MDATEFYALHTGEAPIYRTRTANVHVIELGKVGVESGRLGACDPFVSLETPVVIEIPPGRYPVELTVADVSGGVMPSQNTHEAYLSVVLSKAEWVSVEPAPSPAGVLAPGQAWEVSVRSHAIGFVDAAAVEASMPSQDRVSWRQSTFDNGKPDSWVAMMAHNYPQPAGTANIVMPFATHGENVVLSHAENGRYPVMRTLAADGTVTGIHIDLLLLGTAATDADAQEAAAGKSDVSDNLSGYGTVNPADRPALKTLKRAYVGVGLASAAAMVVSRFTPIPWWVLMPLVLLVGFVVLLRLSRPVATIMPAQGVLAVFTMMWLVDLGLVLLFGFLGWTVMWWLSLGTFVMSGYAVRLSFPYQRKPTGGTASSRKP